MAEVSAKKIGIAPFDRSTDTALPKWFNLLTEKESTKTFLPKRQASTAITGFIYVDKDEEVEPERVQLLETELKTQFRARAIIEPGKQGINYGVRMDTEYDDSTLCLHVVRGTNRYSVHIPTPFKEGAVELIKQNEVKRPVGTYYFVETNQEEDYLTIIRRVLLDYVDGVVPYNLLKEKSSFIQRIAYSFQNETTAVVMYQLQRAINSVVNALPLHETSMNSWGMNQRVVVIDPEFEGITDPQGKLDYQVAKARKLFGRGWTPVGLADGVLATKNYTLRKDFRTTIPFGMSMHNPARNPYSTLGMRGDEEPLVRSQTTQDLIDQGVGRGGWNLNTLFVNVPGVWEDQILIHSKHASKSIKYHRRVQCFGDVQVKAGQVIKYGQIISISEDGRPSKCDVIADKIKVEKIKESTTTVGAIETEVFNVLLSYERCLKEGVKLTNCAANKGIIRLVDNLGVAIDPRDGSEKDIDVIVSAKAVDKRHNFTQIIEALANNINGETIKVYPDNIVIDMPTVEDQLVEVGFPRTGEWVCNTAFGELTGVTGLVYWGVTHDVEDTIWQEGKTTRENGRNLRTSGLKFGQVEARAMETRFGKDNAILDEVMAYSQGSADLHDMIAIIEAKRGNLPKDKPVIDVKNVEQVNQIDGTITTKDKMVGTVADENFLPGGYIIKLPIRYMVVIGEDVEHKKPYTTLYEGPEHFNVNDPSIQEVHIVDKIYVPDINLRRPWRHPSGKYGMTDITAWLNTIVALSHKYIGMPEDPVTLRLLYASIFKYFKGVADKMGSKKGEISINGMAVRYPHSVMATASLSNDLPCNVIQIHRSMAHCLSVKEGDVVLVERFPCLGFMSLRPQKVTITDDPQCKYTIRVSDNSLTSLSLDFDGDKLYLASFHTPEAKELLRKEWNDPNQICIEAINILNQKAGVPNTLTYTLQDYKIHPFNPLTVDTLADIVEKLTGVKANTGPVIALAYNLMRLVENSDIKDDVAMQVAVEMFLDKVGNSVFKQKHGGVSLHSIVIDAVCSGDVELLVQHGFNRTTSTVICDLIRQKAYSIGVKDLASYHAFIKKVGAGNIISKLVRLQNRVYFASRSSLEACELLWHLEQPAVDIPSKMLKWSLAGKSKEEKKAKNKLHSMFQE